MGYVTARDIARIGGLGAEAATAIEYDILHNKLGYSDEAIRLMGQRSLDDIIADYGIGIERRPGQVLNTTALKVTGDAMTMREPADVARETFNRGVITDISDPSRVIQRLRELPESIGIAIDDALKNLGFPDLGSIKKYAGYAALGVGGLLVYKLLKGFKIV